MGWPVQDAKARFSELLEAAVKDGPQVVTKPSVDAAVLVSIEEWRWLQSSSRPELKDLLLGAGPRFADLIPDRRLRRRRPVKL
jgi:antitoxin Phd